MLNVSAENVDKDQNSEIMFFEAEEYQFYLFWSHSFDIFVNKSQT